MVKMKYADLRGFAIQQVMSKIGQTPTSVANAAVIRKVVKAYQECANKITDEFKEDVLGKFGEKDEKGEFKTGPEGYIVQADKEAAFQEEIKNFGEREMKMDVTPLTPNVLSDMRVTPQELDSLHGLFTEENGPGLPHMHAVR